MNRWFETLSNNSLFLTFVTLLPLIIASILLSEGKKIEKDEKDKKFKENLTIVGWVLLIPYIVIIILFVLSKIFPTYSEKIIKMLKLYNSVDTVNVSVPVPVPGTTQNV